jgi:hypothetical protein
VRRPSHVRVALSNRATFQCRPGVLNAIPPRGSTPSGFTSPSPRHRRVRIYIAARQPDLGPVLFSPASPARSGSRLPRVGSMLTARRTRNRIRIVHVEHHHHPAAEDHWTALGPENTMSALIYHDRERLVCDGGRTQRSTSAQPSHGPSARKDDALLTEGSPVRVRIEEPIYFSAPLAARSLTQVSVRNRVTGRSFGTSASLRFGSIPGWTADPASQRRLLEAVFSRLRAERGAG